MVIGKCQACLIDNVRLVKHHWYDNNKYIKMHERFICYSCNTKLSSISSNHILPNWNLQISSIRNNKPLKVKEVTIIKCIKFNPILLEHIAIYSKHDKQSINTWVVNTCEYAIKARERFNILHNISPVIDCNKSGRE